MDKIEGFVKIAASSIAVIIPAILLAVYSYHLGYTTTFGLSQDLIPKSMSDVLVESWYVGVQALAWLMSKWSLLVFLFIFYAVVLTLMFIFLLRAKRRGVTWIFDEITKENQGKNICGLTQWHWICLGDLIKYLSKWFLMPIILLSILGLFTVFPYVGGRNDALKQMEKFQQSGCEGDGASIHCIHLINVAKSREEVISKGILVSANKYRIAVFNNKLEVWPFLDSYIIRKNATRQGEEW